MSKKDKAAKAASTTPAGAAGTTAQAANILHLQVKPGLKFRGARAAWYETALAHDGKPAVAYLQACLDKPPSVPKSGVAEAPQGWLSWFVRNGVVQLVPAQ